MATPGDCNLTHTDGDHRYQAPPEVCAWIFKQLDQLREQASLVIEQYTESYSGLIRTIVGVDRYPLGIKLEPMTNDRFAIIWGIGKWEEYKFVQTKKFNLQRNRFRIYYIDDYLVEAPMELKILAYETENKIERIRKLQHYLLKIIAHFVSYESTSYYGNNDITHSTLKERGQGYENISDPLSQSDRQSCNQVNQWIINQRAILHKEAEYYVTYYWSNNRKSVALEYPSISLGLRIKINRSNSISIEWFEAKFVGKKVFEKKRFKKPRNINTYTILEKLTMSEPKWFAQLVRDTEDELVRIRKMICILFSIKETLLAYQNTDCS
ncbi:conjugative transfer protein MobI(A/C) (plasmid) [Methylomonas sp. HW2-6]|uniref:conjugative transfer protein MobI(A/C) n=1 Tax=Methylomonas sp. HW2-6 TaxID=3376687 RepID=UPI003D533541